MKNLLIIGGGSWGTALAIVLAPRFSQVTLWVYEADLAERMAGIEYRHGDAWVDEIPDAYKSIDVVMADSKELVEVVTSLRQVVNVKGT